MFVDCLKVDANFKPGYEKENIKEEIRFKIQGTSLEILDSTCKHKLLER